MTDEELKDIVRNYIIEVARAEAGDSLHEIEALKDYGDALQHEHEALKDYGDALQRAYDLYDSASIIVDWYEDGPIPGVVDE